MGSPNAQERSPAAILAGRYQLLDPVGAGGMATVWRAWDHRLETERAIKVLAPHLAMRPDLRGRFELEAQTMARLHHPHIVTVHDVAEDRGQPFLVMELMHGGSLWGWIERCGPMAPDLARSVILALLGALAEAHATGVIHRDVKPHNVLLARDGTPRLTDFGIARLIDRASPLTHTGAVLGTPAYMAPELRDGGMRADVRSDLYAVGATWYALLTGQQPFDIYAVEHRDRLMEGIGPEEVALIQRATSYWPHERFADAAEMARALGGERLARPASALATPVTAPGPLPAPTPQETEGATQGSTTFDSLITSMGGTASLPVAPVVAQEVAALPRPSKRRAWGIGGGAALGLALGLGLLSRQDPAPPEAVVTPVAPAAAPAELATVAPPAAETTAAAPLTAPPAAEAAPPTPAPTTHRTHATAAPAPARATGTLYVNSLPWAWISLDGEAMGRTGWHGTVDAGDHEILLRTEDGRTHTLTLALSAGETQRSCWSFTKDGPC